MFNFEMNYAKSIFYFLHKMSLSAARYIS